jgi:hypothetical protein
MPKFFDKMIYLVVVAQLVVACPKHMYIQQFPRPVLLTMHLEAKITPQISGYGFPEASSTFRLRRCKLIPLLGCGSWKITQLQNVAVRWIKPTHKNHFKTQFAIELCVQTVCHWPVLRCYFGEQYQCVNWTPETRFECHLLGNFSGWT